MERNIFILYILKTTAKGLSMKINISLTEMNAILNRNPFLPVFQAWLGCTWPDHLVEPKLHHPLVKKPYLLGWFHCSAHTANRPLSDFKPSYPVWSTTNYCSTHERHYFVTNTNKHQFELLYFSFLLTLECSCLSSTWAVSISTRGYKITLFSWQGDIHIDTYQRPSFILRSL